MGSHSHKNGRKIIDEWRVRVSRVDSHSFTEGQIDR